MFFAFFQAHQKKGSYTVNSVKLDVFSAPFAYFAVKKEDLTAKYAKTAFMPFMVYFPHA